MVHTGTTLLVTLDHLCLDHLRILYTRHPFRNIEMTSSAQACHTRSRMTWRLLQNREELRSGTLSRAMGEVED